MFVTSTEIIFNTMKLFHKNISRKKEKYSQRKVSAFLKAGSFFISTETTAAAKVVFMPEMQITFPAFSLPLKDFVFKTSKTQSTISFV